MESKIFKKFEWKSDGRPFGWGASPDGDWKTILVATFLLIALVSAWSFWTYLNVDKGEPFAAEEGTGEEKPLLDVAALKSVVEYYETKAVEFEKILGGTGTSTALGEPSV
jgi:hypothetical protein